MAFPLRLAGCVAPVLFAGLSMVGCGGSVAPGPGGSSSGVSGSSGSRTDDAGVVRAPWCPSTLPEAGAPCAPTTVPQPGQDSATPPPGVSPECEYGDDPHCTTNGLCTNSNGDTPFQWYVSPPDPSCGGNSAYCPSSSSAFPVNSVGCAGGASCTYQWGRCFCMVCQDNVSSGNPCGQGVTGTEWSCQDWEQPAGCPEPRPLLGTSCSVPMQVCGGSPDPLMKCVEGYWVADE